MSGTTPIRVALCGRHLEDLRRRLRDFPVQVVEELPDLVICYGGDGALLGAERVWPGLPKCPIRDIRRNPKCARHGEEQVIEMLVRGQLRQSRLMKLTGLAPDGSCLRAINDLVVSKENVTSAVRTRIWLDDELFQAQNIGDGLLVATPFGSTGYYQSITGGCFRVGIGLALNNPMTSQGYIVVPEDTVIAVEVLRGPAVLVADNDPVRVTLRDGDRLTVQRARETTVAYGMDIFRCRDCYRLRQDGV